MNLPVFTATLVVIVLIERMCNALCWVVWYLLARTLQSEQAKAQAGMQTTSSLFGSLLQFVGGLLQMAVSMACSLTQYAMTALLVVFLLSLVFVLFESSSLWMMELTRTWNSALGPMVQVLILWPWKLLCAIVQPIIPLWNAAMWIIKKVPFQMLLHVLEHDMGYVGSAVLALGNMAGQVATSILAYAGSFVCCSPSWSILCNAQCYEAGTRVFDLLGPLTYVRQFFAYIASIAHDLCAVISGPIDVLTYPWMDINFAEGLHFLTNSVLYTFLQLPAITWQRCNAYRNESVVMCIPDIAPPISFAVQGLRSVGLAVDNWLDVTVLIVKATLNMTLPVCNAIPSMLSDSTLQTNVFGSNATTMVGLTETLFARTDGQAVQFFSTADSWQTQVKTDAFPFPATVNYGVAAIAHYANADQDSQGDDTMALLGCACTDTSAGMQILCGVAMWGGDQASLYFVPLQGERLSFDIHCVVPRD